MKARQTARVPRRDTELTLVHEWDAGRTTTREDHLAAEEPLEIRIGEKPLSVTMRTPGHDLELATGFLITEGLAERPEQILSVGEFAEAKFTERGNVIQAVLSPDAEASPKRFERNFIAPSSCGICGRASIESVRNRGIPAVNVNFRMAPEILCRLPEALRASQEVFARTGGLHAAALFDASGRLIVEREDIGRHNAVDKVVGWAVRNGRFPLSDAALLVSGRGGFEIVQKAAVAGVPLLASVSACSGLAVRLAREFGVTLVGFVRGSRLVVYTGEQRLLKLA